VISYVIRHPRKLVYHEYRTIEFTVSQKSTLIYQSTWRQWLKNFVTWCCK